MPRARVLRPTFWDSPDTAAASLRCRLLYLAMKNWADDYGIGDATQIRVIGFAFPYDNIPTSEYQPLFDEVAAVYGVVFFHLQGRPFYAIPDWSADQPRERKSKPRPELMQAAAEAVAETRPVIREGGSELPGQTRGTSETNHELPGEEG